MGYPRVTPASLGGPSLQDRHYPAARGEPPRVLTARTRAQCAILAGERVHPIAVLTDGAQVRIDRTKWACKGGDELAK
jgi:hypothetical protein